MLKKLIAIVGLSLFATGCTSTVVKPQDVEAIKMNLENAQAINGHVQAYTKITATTADGTEQDITKWVKQWWSLECTAWSNMNKWSIGASATTAADPFAP